MMAALERGLWPGVAECIGTRTTYDQSYLKKSAMDLALVTFAVEKRIAFLAKVHGQSILRHGQSFARNSRFQRTLGGRARTGRLLRLSIFLRSPFGLFSTCCGLRRRAARAGKPRCGTTWRSISGPISMRRALRATIRIGRS